MSPLLNLWPSSIGKPSNVCQLQWPHLYYVPGTIPGSEHKIIYLIPATAYETGALLTSPYYRWPKGHSLSCLITQQECGRLSPEPTVLLPPNPIETPSWWEECAHITWNNECEAWSSVLSFRHAVTVGFCWDSSHLSPCAVSPNMQFLSSS